MYNGSCYNLNIKYFFYVSHIGSFTKIKYIRYQSEILNIKSFL